MTRGAGSHAVELGGTGVGRRIQLAVGAGFALVLLVGGASVFLAWSLSQGVEHGRHRSVEVQAIDQIHGRVQHFIADLHLALHGGRATAHQPPEEALQELRREVAAYEALEHAQEGNEARDELVRLEDLKVVLGRLEAASTEAMAAAARGQALDLPELARLNELAHEVSRVTQDLHTLHRKKFQRAIDESQRRMRLISALYVAFAIGGGLLILLGNRLVSRTLVLPIVQLAQATLHIAGGDLSRRVPVRSGDEVGQLSRTFNLMAERLEAHEAERLNFQAELGRQVKERTRELEETAARLRTTQVELVRAERIAVTGQLAAGVTHEIRTPLNSLAINVQLLRRELAGRTPVPALQEALGTLRMVEYEVTRINRILDDFVKFARLPTPRFEPVPVAPLLEEVLSLLRAQADGLGVRIEGLSAADVGAVWGDRDQLREVFLNLGQNALQAMPNGGVLGLEIDQDGPWVAITVTDTGPGIPESERERIFLPFVSTKADGLGLGLAIVKRIAEEHGGSVACRNRAEGGARFTVRLPLAERRKA